MQTMKGLDALDLAIRTAALAVLILWLGLTPQSRQLVSALRTSRVAEHRGYYQPATDLMESAAARHPWDASLWERAGRLALQAGDNQKSISLLKHGEDLKRLSILGQIDLATAYSQRGDVEEAIRRWEAALRDPLAPPRTYYQIYLARRSLGDYPGALQALLTLLQVQPEQAQWHYLAGVLLAAQDPPAALPYLEQAAALDETYLPPAREVSSAIRSAAGQEEPAYTLISAGRTLAALQEWDLAAEAFSQAGLTRPDYAEAWAFLGEARQHLPEGLSSGSASALQALQEAIRLDPNSLAANSLLGLYWQRQARYDLALTYLRKAANLDPNNPALRADLAAALALDGQLAPAMNMYSLALKLSANDPAYQKLVVEFCLAYQYALNEVALPMAGNLLTLFPKDPQTVDLFGQVLASQGDAFQAELFFRRALQLDDMYAPAHLHLGLIHLQQGRFAQARQAFTAARASAPGSPAATQAGRLLETYFP